MKNFIVKNSIENNLHNFKDICRLNKHKELIQLFSMFKTAVLNMWVATPFKPLSLKILELQFITVEKLQL